MKGIEDLPAEMLLKIFKLLTPLDLKSAVLVSKYWNEVGDDPSLWSWCTLNLSYGCDIYVLSFRKFKNIEEIAIGSKEVECEVWKPNELQALFEAVIELPKIKEMERRQGIDLKLVDPGLLSRTFAKMEDVGELTSNDLTDDQIEALFTIMAKEETTLKIMQLDYIDLTRLEPELVATVVSKLEKMYICEVNITKEQTKAIFSTLSQGSILKELLIEHIDLSSINTEVLATAVTNLEAVFINSCDLTIAQLTSIFMHVPKNRNIKYLRLLGNYTNFVDFNLVTRARVKLGYNLVLNEVSDMIIDEYNVSDTDNDDDVSYIENDDNLSNADNDKDDVNSIDNDDTVREVDNYVDTD